MALFYNKGGGIAYGMWIRLGQSDTANVTQLASNPKSKQSSNKNNNTLNP